MTLKLLVVFAHPDDESMGMGGTLAKYSAHGVETYYVCASRGERGWFGLKEQNPGLSVPGQIREKELTAAVEELHEDAATAFLAMQGTFYRALRLVTVEGNRKRIYLKV